MPTITVPEGIMSIDDALYQILARVNDPLGDVYYQRAYDLFFEGINTLVQNKDYKLEDIPSMIKTVEVTTIENLTNGNLLWWSPPHNSGNDLFGGYVLEIIDIFANPENGENVRFKRIDYDYYQKMRFDEEYSPLSDEVFWIVDGKAQGSSFAGDGYVGLNPDIPDVFPKVEFQHSVAIRFFPDNIFPTVRFLDFKYLASPVPKKFKVSGPGGTSSVATKIDQLFSMPFIYKVIDFAVQKLSLEKASA